MPVRRLWLKRPNESEEDYEARVKRFEDAIKADEESLKRVRERIDKVMGKEE